MGSLPSLLDLIVGVTLPLEDIVLTITFPCLAVGELVKCDALVVGKTPLGELLETGGMLRDGDGDLFTVGGLLELLETGGIL